MNDFVEKLIRELVDYYKEDPPAYGLIESWDPLTKGTEYLRILAADAESLDTMGNEAGPLFSRILTHLEANAVYVEHLGKLLD